MDRTIDLDQAAVEITRRRSGWESDGFAAGPLTWREEAASWPRKLETDRAKVIDPDSIGVRIDGPGQSEVSVVLFRGGWADLSALSCEGILVMETPSVRSMHDVGALLDACVIRFLRPG